MRPLVDGEPAFRRICEAVETARHSVWVTVAFLESGFEMPDGRGSFFDVLDRAHARGLDVRVLFWRHRVLSKLRPDSHFAGTEADRQLLRRRGTRRHARWDPSQGHSYQHQKSWLVDAGEPGEVAFVGGINLSCKSMAPPGHPATPIGSTHDVYVEVRGPSATDVHHNFVQRWNEASDRGEPDGCWPDARSQTQLAFPAVASPPAGDVPVQIQRTVRRELYRDGPPTPGGVPFGIAGGEFSILDQYRGAIDAARRTIYVHAKIALVDEGWATIGSANLAPRSLYGGDTERNASFWHAPTVRALRVELLREHLARDTSGLDDRAALRLFREQARSNTERWSRGEPLDGLAVALDPARYAE